MNAPALVGRTIAGRFTVTGFVREGAMAAIYRGRQEAEPHEVAIKVILPQLLSDPTFVGRFRREARAAARLNHPNTVRIIDYGVDGRVPYIAMELLEGQDLQELLYVQRRLPEGRAANILLQVCDALSAAHAEGIVHRDLKPENIMLLRDPSDPTVDRVKVLDFGIAKILERETPTSDDLAPSSAAQSVLTTAGIVVGTPAYMAPEQCRGEAVDARSDIYSCGVLLFQLVTGRLPFMGETPIDVAMQHLRSPPPSPTALLPGLHPGIEALILTALAKLPGHRYQSADELHKELQRLLPELKTTTISTAATQEVAVPRLASDAVRTLPLGPVAESSPLPTPQMRRITTLESAATQPSMPAVRIDPAAAAKLQDGVEITARTVAQAAPSMPKPRLGSDTLRALPRPVAQRQHDTPSANAAAAAIAAAPTSDSAPGNASIPVAPASNPSSPGSGPSAIEIRSFEPTPQPGIPTVPYTEPAIHEPASDAIPLVTAAVQSSFTPAPDAGSAAAQAIITSPRADSRLEVAQNGAANAAPAVNGAAMAAQSRPAIRAPQAPAEAEGGSWLAWLIVPAAVLVGVFLGFVAFHIVR